MSTPQHPAADPLLLELYLEEIPSRFAREVGLALGHALSDSLKSSGFGEFTGALIPWESENRGGFSVLTSARRLAVCFWGLPQWTETPPSLKKGPFEDQSYDAQGRMTPALLGFLKSAKADPSQLKKIQEGGKSRMALELPPERRVLKSLILGLLERTLSGLPLPSSMHWGDSPLRFIRPIHSFLCLHGSERIAEDLSLFDRIPERGQLLLERGSAQGAAALLLPCRTPKEYLETLSRASVFLCDEALSLNDALSPRDARARVRSALASLPKESGLAVPLEGLVDENARLCESPFAHVGSFDPRFLKLPREVIQTSMSVHQRCFVMENESGEILPRFAFISPLQNIEKARKGFERVLSARLHDALFFFEEDEKVGLPRMAEHLSTLEYARGLGSMEEKQSRIFSLCQEALSWDEAFAQEDKRAQAQAWLSEVRTLYKADLCSQMVGEFPELQGLMGALYAQDLSPCAKELLRRQYRPPVLNAARPELRLSAWLILSEQLDHYLSFLSVGKEPTGSKDPFGLRRALRYVADVMAAYLPKEKAFEAIDALVEQACARLKVAASLEASECIRLKSLMLQRLIVRCWELEDSTEGLTFSVANDLMKAFESVARETYLQHLKRSSTKVSTSDTEESSDFLSDLNKSDFRLWIFPPNYLALVENLLLAVKENGPEWPQTLKRLDGLLSSTPPMASSVMKDALRLRLLWHTWFPQKLQVLSKEELDSLDDYLPDWDGKIHVSHETTRALCEEINQFLDAHKVNGSEENNLKAHAYLRRLSGVFDPKTILNLGSHLNALSAGTLTDET